MRVRQSDLKTWAKCPLIYKFQNIDGLQREQSGSLTYGSVIHHCVQHLEEHGDLAASIALFENLWAQPTLLDPTYQPKYYVRGTSWKKFFELGPTVLRNWHSIFSWDSSLVLAREYTFDVPIGRNGHVLHGTVDKLEISFRADINSWVVKVVDFKTDKKQPTYDYLAEDLQFSAYGFATTCPEFWVGLGGQAAYEKYKALPRYAEWIQLNGPKRMDAGPRTQRHFNRIEMAVDALAESVAMRIFVPTISGESCRYCEFREPCGLPELDDNGQPVVP